MSVPIISKTISAIYCRDERWDILVRLFYVLSDDFKKATNVALTNEAIVDALTRAGAIKMEAQLIAGRPPRYQIRHLAKSGFRYVKVTAYDDGSITISPSETIDV